jgi:hypothetical protein
LCAADVIRSQTRFGVERGVLAPGPAAAGALASAEIPLLALLLVAALAFYFVGERSDALIIGVIVALSVGLDLSTSTAPRKPPKRCTTNPRRNSAHPRWAGKPRSR